MIKRVILLNIMKVVDKSSISRRLKNMVIGQKAFKIAYFDKN